MKLYLYNYGVCGSVAGHNIYSMHILNEFDLSDGVVRLLNVLDLSELVHPMIHQVYVLKQVQCKLSSCLELLSGNPEFYLEHVDDDGTIETTIAILDTVLMVANESPWVRIA